MEEESKEEVQTVPLIDEEMGIHQKDEDEKALFQAIVLSAGEPFEYLPDGFQAFFESYGISKELNFNEDFFNQSAQRRKLQAVWMLSNEIILKVSRQEQFKTYLMDRVITPLTNES